MDVLYLNGGHSCNDNEDLRLSLRSLDKYAKNIGSVFIIGHTPNFLSSEIIPIYYEQPFKQKHLNMLSSILYAAENSNIDDDFLVFSDDYFLCKEVDLDNYPFYYNGELTDLKKGPFTWINSLVDTREWLLQHNLPVHRFNHHRPKHYNRQILLEMKKLIKEALNSNINIEPALLTLNYWYSKYPFNYEKIEEYKVLTSERLLSILDKTDCFSTPDFTKECKLLPTLFALYPEKSKYEK